jgi:hypothetical protein
LEKSKKHYSTKRKAALQEFLFGSQKISSNNDVDIKKKFKALENKVNSLAEQVPRLQERIIHLENQTLIKDVNPNTRVEGTKSSFKESETSGQGYRTLEVEKDNYRLPNDRNVDPEKQVDLNILSEAAKTSLTAPL